MCVCVKQFFLLTIVQKLFLKTIKKKIFQNYDHKCTATFFVVHSVYHISQLSYQAINNKYKVTLSLLSQHSFRIKSRHVAQNMLSFLVFKDKNTIFEIKKNTIFKIKKNGHRPHTTCS